MSVRATERLIGDVVVVSGLSNSAKMVVQSVDEEAKSITAVWFSDDHAAQTAVFPAKAVDRFEQKEKPARKPRAGAKKPGRRK
ncbi:MAG: hypothetical protein LBE02_07030 [Spirochaetaceae bacterium]|jgi:uncharacterized protein YoxC|nr:hypothetical protein [Spirochaetaceae bacterium]